MLSMIYVGLSILISVVLVCFGLIVQFRNTKNSLNSIFFAFTLFASVWLIANSFSASINFSHNIALFANYITLFSGAISLLFLGLFVKVLTHARLNYQWRIFIFYSVLASILSLTPLVLVDVNPVNGIYEIVFGPLAFVYFFYLPYAFISAVLYLVTYKNRPSTSGNDKETATIILRGIIFTVLGVIITNAILPFVFQNFVFTGVGAYFIVFIVYSLGYATVRHRLFDIRFVVVRSMGYILSVGLLAGIYGFVSFWLIDTILADNISLGTKRLFYVSTALAMAFTFHPLKRFFDKWSNSLFYRDAYDSQELLDRLNSILVSTVDLGKMLQDTSTVVGDTLKTEFMAIGVPGTTGPDSYRIVSTDDRTFSKSDIKQAQILLPKMDGKVVVADYLEDNHSKVKGLMQANDIATIVRMVDNPGQAQEDIGYIILGNKKSGSPFSGQDIKVLTMIADELVLAIQNALRFEEIQNFNKTLEKKVENATSRLQRANDKLVALDQTKDDFISMASHQLRTPLTSVKGYISMVLEGDAGKINEDQKNLLEQAFFSSQRMVYLISDLLNVSRLRTGKFIIEPTPINLADIIESEVAQLKETATARGLKLIYKKPKDFPVLMIDETKIRQVLTNFMDNAIYYTPSGGKIEVNLTNGRQSIELTVVDNGIGVAKHEQHNLFTKFFRAGNAKKARPDGTGLGLFMAKKVIIAQGGAIIFRSAESKGSTFGFTFDKSRLRPKN